MRTYVRRMFAASAVAALVLALPQVALAGPKDKQPVFDFETGEPVAGAFAQVDRTDDAVVSKVRTRVEPGHAVTLWYVIFNNPDACLGGACGEDDIFSAPGVFNFEQIEAARISVVWGKAGDVANPAGRAKLDGGLAVGEVPTSAGITVVIGKPNDGALVPGVATGLEHTAAEVHLVIQDHGPAQDDPDLLELQLTGFQGGCNPNCVDIQFSVHK
ncbi:MAG TPA: hypothetical protein VK925_12710 [Jiangellaceae bacterium]|nr:hypothetical protein [Jiangellaceae bacterium]